MTKLAPGEYKRIPANWPEPVGWYIACPECRSIAVVLAEHVKAQEKAGEVVRMEPWRCAKCRAQYAIEGGRYVRAD